MGTGERPRKQRREQERALRRQVRQTEGAARTLPGGSAERPIDVASSAIVEQRARDIICVQCGGTLELRGDRATSTARGVLREIDVICRQCHAPRTLWFRVAVTAPS